MLSSVFYFRNRSCFVFQLRTDQYGPPHVSASAAIPWLWSSKREWWIHGEIMAPTLGMSSRKLCDSTTRSRQRRSHAYHLEVQQTHCLNLRIRKQILILPKLCNGSLCKYLVEGFGFSCWLLHVLQMFWISENQWLVNCQLPAARKDLIRQAMMYSRQKNPHGLFFFMN